MMYAPVGLTLILIIVLTFKTELVGVFVATVASATLFLQVCLIASGSSRALLYNWGLLGAFLAVLLWTAFRQSTKLQKPPEEDK